MLTKERLLCILLIFFSLKGISQVSSKNWNGKKCAVVLTYDDALDVHLDIVIPALDSLKMKGTFYLIGSSENVNRRLNDWRKAAKNGHELGNHSLNHPCDASLPGRDFAKGEGDLSKYSVARTVREIRAANTLLKAIDGKEKRTFAYPCGDLKVRDTLFYPQLQNEFSGARGVTSDYVRIKDADLSNLNAFSQVGSTGEQMIEQVKQAQKDGTCIVFLFHGVGGGHSLNVASNEHKKLLNYLAQHRNEIWIAPMVDVAEFLKKAKR